MRRCLNRDDPLYHGKATIPKHFLPGEIGRRCRSAGICSRVIAVLPRFDRGDETGELVIERTGLEPSLIAFCKSYENVRPGDRFSRQRDWPRDAFQFQGRKFGFTRPSIPSPDPIDQPDRILRPRVLPGKEKRS